MLFLGRQVVHASKEAYYTITVLYYNIALYVLHIINIVLIVYYI